jgi:hypothetical protein
LQADHSTQVTELLPNHTLNTYITLVELFQALKKLQRIKAAGLDGMKVEFILDAGELLHMPLLTMLNYFLVEGFLEALSIGVVHALFKGGDASTFDNYRGIMVGPILAKLFAMIFDKRLSKWVEQHGLCAKGQVGFCKDYRTTDQLFILQILIEQSKAKKKSLYCCLWTSKRCLILCRVKCFGRCWLALGWRDASCDVCKQCMPRIPYASTTQARVSPPALGASKV